MVHVPFETLGLYPFPSPLRELSHFLVLYIFLFICPYLPVLDLSCGM